MRLWHVFPSALAKHEGRPWPRGIRRTRPLAMVLVCPWPRGFLGLGSFLLAAPWWRLFGLGRFSWACPPRLFRCDQLVPRPLPLCRGGFFRRLLGLGSSPLATPSWWLLGLGGSSQAGPPWRFLGLGGSSWLARRCRLLLAGRSPASAPPPIGAARLPPPCPTRVACPPPIIVLRRHSEAWVLTYALVSARVVLGACCGVVQVHPSSA